MSLSPRPARSHPGRLLAVLVTTSALALAGAMGPALAGPPQPRVTLHRAITATTFWVGEPAGPDNLFITNASSAWEGHWVANFGGVDDPTRRLGFDPAGFTPKENPFYLALPYDTFDNSGRTKPSAALLGALGWTAPPGESAVKNRWVRVRLGARVAYGQWEDVGPELTDDFSYVFGTARPHNRTLLGAGIDLSPAMETAVGGTGDDLVDWEFVSAADVAPGPWRRTVTTIGVTP